MCLEESSLFPTAVNDLSQEKVLVLDLSSHFENAPDENATWIEIDQLRKALSAFRKSNERSNSERSASGQRPGRHHLPQSVSVSVFLDKVVLEAVIRTQSRINGFIKSEANDDTHSIIDPISHPDTTFVIDLRMLQEVTDRFPGAKVAFSTSKIKNRLMIKQGTTHLCVDLRNNDEHRNYLASLGSPILRCSLDPLGLGTALNYLVAMANSDGGHRNQSISIQHGLALSGGGDLLAIWESSTLSGIDANLPLKSASLYSQALSKLHPDRSRFIKFANSYIFTDGSISVGSEAGSFLAGPSKVVSTWRYDSVIDISKDMLLDNLRRFRVITHINTSSVMDERDMTDSTQAAKQDRDAKSSTSPKQDGKSVEITICGDGTEANISLLMFYPTGKGIGRTPKPLSCIRRAIDPTQDSAKELKIMVDLADWLRAVDMTSGDIIQLSVAFAKTVPQALVVIGSGSLNRPANEASPYTTRCFLTLKRRGRNGKAS